MMDFKNLLTSLLFTAMISVPGSSLAAEVRARPMAVLELFTSQGCSSCPAADAVLDDLDERTDVIALAYHIDYWDYIGWEDTFGDPAFSRHQRAYADAQGKPRIYTPQMIVNGNVDIVGSHRSEVMETLEKSTLALDVQLTPEGTDMLEIDISGQVDHHEAAVWLVTYKSEANVDVQRGENSGKVLRYTQIVTDRQVLGMWEPQTGAHIKLPLSELLGEMSDGLAIIVQEERDGLPGSILGAASYEL